MFDVLTSQTVAATTDTSAVNAKVVRQVDQSDES